MSFKARHPRVNFARHTMRADSGCLEWTAQKLPRGYGIFHLNEAKTTAHRAAWILANGPIPDGLMVCHRCDNRACVDVAHLFLGTAKDNTQDMIAKGRDDMRHRKGERSPMARLTADQVIAIRASTESHKKIAKRLGVHNSTVYFARTRVTWKHIP